MSPKVSLVLLAVLPILLTEYGFQSRARMVEGFRANWRLTAHELKLMSYLMHHQGKVISRTELVEHIYDQEFDRDSNTIEVFVGRLRKKLGVDVIRTLRGQGYMMAPPGDDS